MRVVRLILSLLLILSSSPRLSSQQSTTPPQRDPQAVAVLQNSIAKMGGSAAVANVTDAVVTGSVAPTSGSSAKSGTFKWETAGAEYRYDFQLGATTQSFLSGHGQPANIHNGAVSALSPQIALSNSALHLPPLVLASAIANNMLSVVLGGKTTVNGSPAIKVRIFSNADMLSAIVSVQG